MFLLSILIMALPTFCVSLDNGLGQTPPMGWLSWLRYRCTIDCMNHTNDCINENLIMQMADKMALDYKDVGYQYVMIDDCWLSPNRSSNDSLLPDPVRFPRGMKFLSDYIHSKGLKFGIYEDYGIKTCAGYPGSIGYLKIDADTFASWGVDYVKFDGCWSLPNFQPFGIELFSKFLNQTGRRIFLNVEWPQYIGIHSLSQLEITLLKRTTNMARVYNDIDDNWKSLLSVINFYKQNSNNFSSWAQPGYFNDPDMLLIGNNYITSDQEKLQMTMWSIFAAPLIMSNDLRNISQISKSILTNKDVISINQDPSGIQGRFIKTIGNFDFWLRPLTPIFGQQHFAIGILNLGNQTYKGSFTLSSLKITGKGKFRLTDVFLGEDSIITSDELIELEINPTSSLLLQCQPYQ